jgi:hypothetical protein
MIRIPAAVCKERATKPAPKTTASGGCAEFGLGLCCSLVIPPGRDGYALPVREHSRLARGQMGDSNSTIMDRFWSRRDPRQ